MWAASSTAQKFHRAPFKQIMLSFFARVIYWVSSCDDQSLYVCVTWHSCVFFLPGFQLRPTFSEQPPTNGVKTRLVKMCRGQHTAASLLLCVKTAIGRTGIEQFSTFVKKKKNNFTQSKRYVLVVRAEGFFSLCVSLVKELDGCLVPLSQGFFFFFKGIMYKQITQLTNETLNWFDLFNLEVIWILWLSRRGYISQCFYPARARFTSLPCFSSCFCSFSSCSLFCWASHSCFIIRWEHKMT